MAQPEMRSPCPSCDASNIVKYGKSRNGVQIYLCKSCGKRFTASGAMPGRRVPPEQVGTAVSMFYDGLSLEAIRRTFGHTFDFQPSTGSIYEWIVDYTHLAKAETGKLKPNTGDTWVADEIVINVAGKKYWNWNVMDARTRFLLAARFSPNRGTKDAEMVMRQALERAGKPPGFIVTDRLASYVDGIERVFGADSKHVQSGGIKATINNNLSERLQGTIRQREKVMRGLKSPQSAQLVMDGWAIHYNFFRPHEGLDDKTPASAAGLETPLTNWEEVAKLDVRPFSHRRVALERERLQAGLVKHRRPRELRDRRLRPRMGSGRPF